MKKTRFLFLPALFALLFISACNDDESQTARLKITLVDNPGDFEAVNVDIQGVTVHTNEHAGEEDNGWVFLENSNVGIKNLLEYTGGVELTLADTDFPAGRISQIRLLLGENNSVTIDGKSEPLETPSAQQSGLKLQVHETLKGGITYEFKLDFEAAQSVVITEAGTKILKPVINVFTKALSGSIKGSVLPADENVVLYIMDGVDIVSTTYAPAGTAEFLFADVPEGIYSVLIETGGGSTYASQTIENVVSNIGDVTDLGEIQLAPKE